MARSQTKLVEPQQPTLLQSVNEIQAAIDALIEERTSILAASIQGLPRGILRQEITKNEHCQCRIARRLLQQK